ncbi:MAG: NTP transferase domain-containing protein [Firmicutes bacterium]|nr:NTP transferase domain-containing protein [Bacillota bacterium]
MVECVILAGGLNEELTATEAVPNKALLKIGRKEMVRYVLEACSQVEEIKRIALVGPVEIFSFLQKDYPLQLVPEGDSMLDNVVAANRSLQTTNPLLISTADIPFLNPAAVNDFLQQCLPYNEDFYYPIVTREECEKKFPGAQRTFVTLQEGVFTGGNMFLVNPKKIDSSLPLVRHLLEHRKNPLKMVSFFGTGFVLRALTKRLTIADLESRFSALLDVKARAVISRYAEISFDVDKVSDLARARQIFGEQDEVKEDT